MRDELAAEAYLEFRPLSEQRKAHQLRAAGAVQTLGQPSRAGIYSAAVRDKRLWSVDLQYSDEDWRGVCTCSDGVDCVHCAAALLAYRAAAGYVIPRPTRQQAPRVKAPPRPPLPPDAQELASRLTEALQRPLEPAEEEFLRKLQELHDKTTTRRPTNYDLWPLLQLPGNSFDTAQVWQEHPDTLHECWQYLVHAARLHKVAIPPFMEPLSDCTAVAQRIADWQRKKVVADATARFSHLSLSAHTTPRTIALRLVFGRQHAVIEGKRETAEPFTPLKPHDMRALSDAANQHLLALDPDTQLLWTCLLTAWPAASEVAIPYELDYCGELLGLILRIPALASLTVTADGQPLARPAGALRWALLPAASGDDDCVLALCQPDGTECTDVVAVFHGVPTLYLTPSAVYAGTPHHRYAAHCQRLSLPRPALYTTAGVRFLQDLRVELPPDLARRIHHVPPDVTLSARIDNQGPHHEIAVLDARARLYDDSSAALRESGWITVNRAQRAKPDDELIHFVDMTPLYALQEAMAAFGARWDEQAKAWTVRVTRTFPERFTAWLATLPPAVQVQLDTLLNSLTEAPIAARLHVDVREAAIDWFDLSVKLDVADTRLTPDELEALLKARGQFVRLGQKGWRRLTPQWTDEDREHLADLGLSADDCTGEPQRLHVLQLAAPHAARLLPAERVTEVQRRVSELQARVTPPLPAAIQATLRPYQVDGFHFLAYLAANRFGGVLADDMGLGKTVQTLTWLAWLRATQAAEAPAQQPLPSLVVCPKSVMENWHSEAARFYPELGVRFWKPSADLAEWTRARADAGLLVLNYAQLRLLTPEQLARPWLAAVLDEAQAVKNPTSLTAQTARTLVASHRLALTGTPIENRLLDLWSIMAYAMPGALGARNAFLRTYDAASDGLARRRLSARVRPFLLRRRKEQVAQDLPPRVEEDILCTLEEKQATQYQAELKHARQMLLNMQTQADLNRDRFNVLTSLLRLRQICCHPALVNPSLRHAGSAKLEALTDLVEPLIEEGHKVLVFSQFVTLLDIVRDLAVEKEWPHFYLTGQTEERGALIQAFQAHAGGAVFLLSLKAGGFGLNLTAASYVVLFDPWWNPAVERQAIDRTHRIGQTETVNAYRLIVKDSIEEKIRLMQQKKAALADDVLGEERFAEALTLDDLRHLLGGES